MKVKPWLAGLALGIALCAPTIVRAQEDSGNNTTGTSSAGNGNGQVRHDGRVNLQNAPVADPANGAKSNPPDFTGTKLRTIATRRGVSAHRSSGTRLTSTSVSRGGLIGAPVPNMHPMYAHRSYSSPTRRTLLHRQSARRHMHHLAHHSAGA